MLWVLAVMGFLICLPSMVSDAARRRLTVWFSAESLDPARRPHAWLTDHSGLRSRHSAWRLRLSCCVWYCPWCLPWAAAPAWSLRRCVQYPRTTLGAACCDRPCLCRSRPAAVAWPIVPFRKSPLTPDLAFCRIFFSHSPRDSHYISRRILRVPPTGYFVKILRSCPLAGLQGCRLTLQSRVSGGKRGPAGD